MVRHEDFEYGILLEVTIGFVVHTLHPGRVVGFDSPIPHLFRDPGAVVARGIWVLHDR